MEEFRDVGEEELHASGVITLSQGKGISRTQKRGMLPTGQMRRGLRSCHVVFLLAERYDTSPRNLECEEGLTVWKLRNLRER